MVRRIEEIQSSEIQRVGDREYVMIHDQAIPVLRLDRYVKVSPATAQDKMYLLLPRHMKEPIGILFSQIIDTEIALIQLDTQSHREDGIMGTAVVRERMTLFLDLYRLADRFAEERRALGPPPPQVQGRCPRILAVDDTQFFRQLVRNYLESEGYEVVT